MGLPPRSSQPPATNHAGTESRGYESAECAWVLTRPHLRKVVAHIRRGDRVEPVIGLTSRPGERHPAFSPGDVRAIAGEHARLYFIPTGFLTATLALKLGERLSVADGDARIWWATPSPRAADRHPRIGCPTADGHGDALNEFARLFKATRPLTGAYLDVLERERDEAKRYAHALSARAAR